MMKKLPYILSMVGFFCLIFLVQIYFDDIKKPSSENSKEDEYANFYTTLFQNTRFNLPDGTVLNLMKLDHPKTLIAFVSNDCPACALFEHDLKNDPNLAIQLKSNMNLILISNDLKPNLEIFVKFLFVDTEIFKKWRIESVPTFLFFEEEKFSNIIQGYAQNDFKKSLKEFSEQ